MYPGRNLFGLSAQAKARLIEKLSSAAGPPSRPPSRSDEGARAMAARLDVSQLEGSREIRMIREAAEFLGISDPFFRVHEGVAGAETVIEGRKDLISVFVTYEDANGQKLSDETGAT